MPETKTCSKCGADKPLAAFSKNRRRPDGLQVKCKACFAEYYRAHAERMRETSRAWIAANPERHAATKERIRSERRAGERGYIARTDKFCRRCGERHPRAAFSVDAVAEDGLQQYCKPCRAAQQRDLRRRRRENGPTVARTDKRCPDCGATKALEEFDVNRSQADGRDAWCRACRKRRDQTPEGRASRVQRSNVRRARENRAPSERIDRRDVFERDGGICHICRLPASPDDWHLDHVIPLSRGGAHLWDNVAVAHPACNIRKAARI